MQHQGMSSFWLASFNRLPQGQNRSSQHMQHMQQAMQRVWGPYLNMASACRPPILYRMTSVISSMKSTLVTAATTATTMLATGWWDCGRGGEGGGHVRGWTAI